LSGQPEGFFRYGWNIGAGLEYRFWSNWSAFTQYSYTKYGSINVTFPVANVRSNSTLAANALVFGVNYRF
jgi:opacity protein-like surface antigen